MATAHSRLEGGCHCGAITLAFSTALTPETTSPRACDCSFCRAHGAAWISDPAGQLDIHAQADRLRRYRQGSLAAQFLLCGECGVLVGVLHEDGGRRYAAVNAACLEARDAFAASVPASPRTLSADEKTTRWRQLWIGDVRLMI
ncbi:MAG TPA: aldehyde-activating protein [Pseudoxanthomonas sp.]|nr:aldehyde-activating protein [Pseudoxanthomonas sp.]